MKPTAIPLLSCLAFALSLALPQAQAADPPSLSSHIPGGAYTFVEASGLAEIIGSVQGSEILNGVLQSEDFAELRKKKWFRQLESSKNTMEFVLRMSLWEASSKLLGGRVAFAVYPAASGTDPEVSLLVRPSEPSDWLRDRVKTAPLLRIGLKRIGRIDFGEHVAAYRTRGFNKDKATYFALHDNWVAVASNEELLKKTVVLQAPTDIRLGDPCARIGDEVAFQRMTKRMGAAHFGRGFVDTQRVAQLAKEAGPNFGLPAHIDDPMLSLFLGGISELLDNSRFAGFALDLHGKQVRFTSGIDARPKDVAEQYRIFFSENPNTGMQPLPEVAGLIGGFTLYRQFGSWYRSRGDVLKNSIIPGIEGFQGDVGDLLLGRTDPAGKSIVGDKVAFLAAMRDDSGAEANGAALPGFAFIVDLANPTHADKTVPGIFDGVLDSIRDADSRNLQWQRSGGSHLGVPVKYATNSATGRELTPATARVGDKLIVSSSRLLCHDLIATLKKKDRGLEKGKDLVFHLRSTPLAALLRTNREEYFGQLIRDGRSPQQALDDLKNINNLLALFSSIEGSTTAANGIFETHVCGQLR